DLFHRAQRGMKITGATHALLKPEILALPKKEGLDRIISLLHILKILSETRDYYFLASAGYSHAYNAKDNHKIDEVFKYVMNNFAREISLQDVASITNLSPQSFCRFFKNRTRKSFVQFLNEVRIGHACKRLTEEDWSIAEIAYSCGFKNLSNFNRFFKEIVGKTPKEYKQELRLKEA
ncbi:MAG TPA: AraC family transcriptional regulator, partial [Chitinophaga sp.]